jgi:hypothetical protein
MTTWPPRLPAAVSESTMAGPGDGHKNDLGGRHRLGDGGGVSALTPLLRQRVGPGGILCREGDLVPGGVPESADRRADMAGTQNRDPHLFSL